MEKETSLNNQHAEFAEKKLKKKSARKTNVKDTVGSMQNDGPSPEDLLQLEEELKKEKAGLSGNNLSTDVQIVKDNGLNGKYVDIDSATRYMNEAGAITLLTKEEELKVSRDSKNGNQHERARFAKSNLRFVIRLAKRYMNKGLPFLDLIQEGNVGLMKAVDRFDPDRGYRFTTYATWWIRDSIIKAIADKSSVIRVSRGTNQLIGKILEIERLRGKDMGLSDEEVAEMLHEDSQDIKDARYANKIRNPLSFEAKIEEKGDKETLQNPLLDPTAERSSDGIEQYLAHRDLNVLLNKYLEPWQIDTIRKLLKSGMDYEAVSKELGISVGALYSRHSKCLKILRSCVKRDGLV